jgi:hypothetical protein
MKLAKSGGRGAGQDVTRDPEGPINGGLIYTDADGREWTVTLESPGKILSVPASLEKSGALLPEHEVRIVFTSGEESVSQEYTAMVPLEDLSAAELAEWFDGAISGSGL